MALSTDYNRGAEHMLAAARAWRDANPNVELVFHGLGYAPGTVVIGDLSRAIIRRVGGNAKTRELLRVIDTATGNQGTILQAEVCVEMVFGLRRAISGKAEGQTTRVPASSCPECHKSLDMATLPSGRGKPTPGDFSVCLYCGAVLRFDNDLRLRTTTLAERSELPPHALEVFQIAAVMRASKP